MAVTTLNTTRIVGIVIAVVILFVLGFVIGWVAAPTDDDGECTLKVIAKKRREDIEEKNDFHEELFEILNAENIGENLRYFSKHPHVGGTKRSKDLADEIAKRWQEYQFDKVELPEYNILLPYVDPNVSNSVQIRDSNNQITFEFSGREKIADPSEKDPDMIAPLLAFAKEGVAEGKLLYVNYGRTEDFAVLRKSLSIPNCTDYIVIMRFGKIYRGDKVKNAQDCGAKGAILYNDPKDYAKLGQDKVYPHYIWLPKTGVQRGSIFKGRGDPLTPGLPSIDGIFRINMDNAVLPKIPATPMPYGDAVHVMGIMKGQDVPESWKGSLNIDYKLGDGGLGNNTVRIQVNVPNRRQNVYNVIGTVYGREEPDRWVLIGNHRDAWGFGAVDASSGTSAMMELSRGVSELLKKGWRPRRTIKFCSWGAEESGLIGSTEWVEENERALSTKAITYINVDIAVDGNHSFSLAGSPLLKTAIIENVKKVDDPHGGKVYERMVAVNDKFTYRNLGSGSDYASFYQFIGVPSLDMTYAGEVFYPVYHTVHDTYKWLHGLIDPDFVYHLTTTKVAARLLMYTADSIVLPMNVTEYGRSLDTALAGLEQDYNTELTENDVTLKYLENAINNFKKQAAEFQKEKKDAIDTKDDIRLRDLNDRMVNVEKAFIYALGLPNQEITRHVLFAPSVNNAYGSTSFPGISDLMFKKSKTASDWEEIKKQTSVAFKSIAAATDALKADAKQKN